MSTPDGDLTGRHCLVTGAAGGIGQAVVRNLLAVGASVTLAGRNRERLEHFAGALPADRIKLIWSFDVTDANAVTDGVAAARATFGPISILVNNAGEAPTAPFDKMTSAFWSKVIDTDLTGAFNVTQAVLADIKACSIGGRIVNIASTAGLIGYRYVSAYSAAKHGLVGLTRSLALELATTRVTVNAVCPGFTDTPLVDRAVDGIVTKTGRDTRDIRMELTKANPQGRLVQPDEVANAVLWLVRPSTSSVTGQAIVIAGGEVMAG